MKLLVAAAALVAVSFAQSASAATVDLDWDITVGPALNATISVGDTVRWTWTDALPHQAISSSGPTSFDSGIFAGLGETFSYTFNEVGEWTYLCGVHGPAAMGGTITVVATDVPALGGVGISSLCALLIASGLAISRFRRVRA